MEESLATLKSLVSHNKWHLAPMHKGEIVRDSKTLKKKHPAFIANWRDKALTEQLQASKVDNDRPYLVCTGQESNLIALDCDNDVTASIIRAIDPDNTWVVTPIDKPGITLLYKYDKDLHKSFATKRAPLEFDFLSTGRGMFLPSSANKTKETWESLPEGELPSIPEVLKTYLLNVMMAQPDVASAQHTKDADYTQQSTYPALQPLVSEVAESKKLNKNLLSILTTHKMRAEHARDYNTLGYVGPKEIAKGEGSLYLLGVSTILGGDESISASLYLSIIELLNKNLQAPLDDARLENTITKPMLDKKSKVGSRIIWKYNKNWKASGLTLLDKNKDLLYILIDSQTYDPLIINMGQRRVKREGKAAECAATLRVLTGDAIKPLLIEQRAALAPIVTNFKKGFGAIEESSPIEFNIFQESEALAILKNPKLFLDKYRGTKFPQAPDTTLAFLSHLIPKEEHKDFLIRFLKTKLSKFTPSPIILNFTGAPGSGKDTLFEWIQLLVNELYTSKPTTEQMLGPYNGWMENSLFVLCNEYPDSLKPSQYSEMKGRLKEISGSPSFLCREMRLSPRPATHLITLITAQNFSAPLADAGDRRHFYINTPRPLDTWGRLKSYESAPDEGDMMTNFRTQLFAEVPAFAYYLATQVEFMKDAEYIKAPEQQGANKFERIDDKTARLAYILQCRDWEYLLDVIASLEYEVDERDLSCMAKSLLPLTIAKEMLNYWGYSCTTNHLNMAMASTGIDKSRQYKVDQKKVVCFNVPDLDKMDFGTLRDTNDFEPDQEEDDFTYES